MLKEEEVEMVIIEKLFSGRWLLTVACAIAFLYAVWKRILPDTAIVAIIVSVFKDYFNRSDRNGNGGTK